MALTQVSSGGIKDGSITNADLDSSAALDGSKVSPDFGSQNIVTTGTITGASLIPSSNTVPANGIYLSGTNTVAVATNGTGRLFIDASGKVEVSTATGSSSITPTELRISSTTDANNWNTTDPWARLGFYSADTTNGARTRAAIDVVQQFTNGNVSAFSFKTDNGSGTLVERQRITYTGTTTLTSAAATEPLIVKIDTSEVARIDSSGRVGIGTSSPGALLHLSSATGSASPTPTELRIATTTNASDWSTTDPWGRISFYNADTSAAGPKIHAAITATALNASAPTSDLKFAVNAGGSNTLFDALTIKGSSGFVGIGSTNPSAMLTLRSDLATAATVLRLENLNASGGVTTQSVGIVGVLDYNTGGSVASAGSITFGKEGTYTTSTAEIDGYLGFATTLNNSITEKCRITSDGKLLVGTSSASGAALLQVQTPTTLSTTADTGVAFTNTSTKTYPTTSSFSLTAGLEQNIELGTAQTINAATPGGFNFVYGTENLFTKSAGNTQDIERLYFAGFSQRFAWTDANTCKQYVGFQDSFAYAGINANGRTSSSSSATSINLSPPDGGTQTISNVSGNTITLLPQGTSTINITNSSNTGASLNIYNFNAGAGTKTVNITNHAFFQTSQWGVYGATGTLNATITNLYGLRLTAPFSSTGLTVTNNWGIRQEWSSAKNWFAGASNQFPNITTTASGANAFLNSADSNRLYRSTSSIVYKKDVENLDHALADNIHQFRPVWYRSNCAADCQDWSWFGLIAEEVAAIEPRLVHYGYQEDAYELVDITDTVELQPDDPRREAGQETKEVTKQERRLKDDAQQVPNGVAYDRLTVLLLDVVQRQEDRIKDLEARLSALETA